jgi:hypothetical protein
MRSASAARGSRSQSSSWATLPSTIRSPRGIQLVHAGPKGSVEEVLDARVLHDQVLAAHRPQRAVGHQVARPDAGAVDDRGTISRRLGQRVNRPQFDLDSGRLQPSREILEVSGHIHDREGDPEHSAECVRRIAGPHLHPGEELRRRRLAAA